MGHYKNLCYESMDGEEWRKIPDVSATYEVSNFGRVRSIKNKIIRRQGLSNSGYPCVVVWDGGKYKSIFSHRAVAKAFISNPENKPTVNHIDGDKANNQVSNLEWATYSENEKHSYRAGLKSHKGEKNGMAVLTEEKVMEIRKYHITKPPKFLAEKYGVSETTIRYVIRGDSWRNL